MSELRAAPLFLAGLAAMSACATKGQVRLLNAEVQTLRVESARRDSARAAALAAVLTLQQRIMDSLGAGREALGRVEARIQTDFTDIQRQLIQVQELTGQSQQRLSELKAQLDARAEQAAAAGRPPGAPADTGGGGVRPSGPTADQMYQNARNLHGRGALSTARAGYQAFLQAYPSDPRAPDALFFIGETFGTPAPDSASAYYAQVVARFPQAAKVPTALYRLGGLAESRRDAQAARNFYERILRDHPRSNEAELAQDRLRNLRP